MQETLWAHGFTPVTFPRVPTPPYDASQYNSDNGKILTDAGWTEVFPSNISSGQELYTAGKVLIAVWDGGAGDRSSGYASSAGHIAIVVNLWASQHLQTGGYWIGPLANKQGDWTFRVLQDDWGGCFGSPPDAPNTWQFHYPGGLPAGLHFYTRALGSAL